MCRLGPADLSFGFLAEITWLHFWITLLPLQVIPCIPSFLSNLSPISSPMLVNSWDFLEFTFLFLLTQSCYLSTCQLIRSTRRALQLPQGSLPCCYQGHEFRLLRPQRAADQEPCFLPLSVRLCFGTRMAHEMSNPRGRSSICLKTVRVGSLLDIK